MKPAKIPRPPSGVMGALCTLRASGISKSFFISATLITAGMARNVMVNEIAIESKTSNISLILIHEQK